MIRRAQENAVCNVEEDTLVMVDKLSTSMSNITLSDS